MISRTAEILEAVVDGFIDTGEPISSGWLYEHYDFGIKPAMIRSELDGLSHCGFLEQPHRSAGRVPSNKGYEFFAERALQRHDGSLAGINWALNLFRRGAWENLVNELSNQLGLVAVAKERGEIYKTGIDELVENLDWDEPSEIKTAIKDFIGLEEGIRMAKRLFKNTPRVFVGKKSPVTKSGGLAVIGGMYQSSDGEILLLAIGPKRMDYKRAIKIFSALGGSASGGKNTNGRKRK